MKKYLSLALILMILLIPAIAAADVTNADYRTTVSITNNGTAATSVTVNCSLNMTALISGGIIDASCVYANLLDPSGVAVPFMPTPSTLFLFVPSIGASSQVNRYYYTDTTSDVTGGKLCYIPGAIGMETADSAPLEKGSNFADIFKGWFITSATEGATANCTPGSASLSASAGIGSWNAAQCVDGNTTTTGFITDAAGIGQYVRIDFGSGNATALYQWRYYTSPTDIHAVFNVQYSDDAASWSNAYTGWNLQDGAGGWHSASWAYMGAHRYWQTYKTNGASGGDYCRELDVAGFDVTLPCITQKGDYQLYGASGNITLRYGGTVVSAVVSEGAHTLVVTDNATSGNLEIWVDGSIVATGALTAIADTTENITDCQPGAMPYVESVERYVGGVQRQLITFQYVGATANFTDQSGNGHHATPSYPTGGSSANVSGAVTAFESLKETGMPSTASVGGTVLVPLSGSGNMTTEPDNLFREGGTSFWGAAEVRQLEVDLHEDQGVISIPVALLICLIFGIACYVPTQKTRMGQRGSALIFFIATEAAIAFFVYVGGGILPGFALIPFGLCSLLLLIFRNPFNPVAS